MQHEWDLRRSLSNYYTKCNSASEALVADGNVVIYSCLKLRTLVHSVSKMVVKLKSNCVEPDGANESEYYVYLVGTVHVNEHT